MIDQSINQRDKETFGATWQYVVSRECGKGVLKCGVIGVGTFVKTGLQLHEQLVLGWGRVGLMC